MKPRHIWTNNSVKYILENYPNIRTDAISKKLGLTVGQVYSKAKRLGVKKSAEFLKSKDSGRADGTKGKNSRFQPGQTSWNKGKSYQAGGASIKTQFQAGNKSHNWKPIGTFRINSFGYLDKKITDLPGSNNVRWYPVHRLVWIEAHGPVPDQHIIVFKEGMKTNVLEKITLDILDCISRADHSRNNHPYSRGPEFGYLTRLKGAITRHVNRIIRDQNEATQ